MCRQKAISRSFDSEFTKIRKFQRGNVFNEPKLTNIISQENVHLLNAVTQQNMYMECDVPNPGDSYALIQGMLRYVTVICGQLGHYLQIKQIRQTDH